MTLQLITTPSGLIALVLRNHLIIQGDTADDSGVLVQTTADNLSAALCAQIIPQRENWSFDDLMARFVTNVPGAAVVKVCAKCGTRLNSGLCNDLTCPYSTWPQEVSLADMSTYSEDELIIKYGLIRAEAHSDDQVVSESFYANEWFIEAADKDILQLVSDNWGRSRMADSIAQHFEDNSLLSPLFDYLATCNSIRHEMGFECTVNSDDAMAWLQCQRHGLWAQILCGEHQVRLIESSDPDSEGMWDWLGPNGNGCEISFDSADEAAVDAVKQLGLAADTQKTPLYEGYWDASIFQSDNGIDQRHIIGPAMICNAHGYSAEDIAEISKMTLGGSWAGSEYGFAHTLRRIR